MINEEERKCGYLGDFSMWRRGDNEMDKRWVKEYDG